MTRIQRRSLPMTRRYSRAEACGAQQTSGLLLIALPTVLVSLLLLLGTKLLPSSPHVLSSFPQWDEVQQEWNQIENGVSKLYSKEQIKQNIYVASCKTEADMPAVSSNTQRQHRRAQVFAQSSCGRLWNGEIHDDSLATSRNAKSLTDNSLAISVVVAYCQSPLQWLRKVLMEDLMAHPSVKKVSVVIYSKCGTSREAVLSMLKMDNTPLDATDHNDTSLNIRIDDTLPNVGGCDHTYAHWIAKHAHETVADYVFFLKDTERRNDLLTIKGRYRSLQDMLELASSTGGFSCGYVNDEPNGNPAGLAKDFVNSVMSAYHVTRQVYAFDMKTHIHQRASLKKGLVRSSSWYWLSGGSNSNDAVVSIEAPFVSPKWNSVGHLLQEGLGDTARSLPIGQPDRFPFIEVCYGGTFIVSKERLETVSQEIWTTLADSVLNRGNSIEEGHYMERMWAGMLATPLTVMEMYALTKFANGFHEVTNSMTGSLRRIWTDPLPRQLYIRQVRRRLVERMKMSSQDSSTFFLYRRLENVFLFLAYGLVDNGTCDTTAFEHIDDF